MKQERRINWLVAILFSLITGFIISSMIFTGGNMDKFYNEGDILEVPRKDMNMTLAGILYSEDGQQYTVTETNASMSWTSYAKNNAWKYIDISLSDMNQENLVIRLNYYTLKNKRAGKEDITLSEGENRYTINPKKPFSYIVATIEGQPQAEFRLDYVKLRTEVPDTNFKTVVLYGMGMAVLCLALWCVLSHLLRKRIGSGDWYILVVTLQKLYIRMAAILLKKVPDLSEKTKKYLRITLFAVLFAVLSFVNVYGLYFKEVPHRNLMIFFVILLLFQAVLYHPGKLSLQNWKNPLVKFWLLQWGLACVSDFVVAKKNPFFSFYGYVMIFVMGFLFFIWSNRRDMEEIRREIAHAVEVTFWLSTVYCLLFRPEVPGFRYNGFYTNPNPYGLYMAVVICIFLAELDTCIKREKKNWKRMAACAAGIDIALFFLYKTQCATGILALGVAGIIWLTGYMGKGIPKVWQKQCIRSVFLIIVAFLPVFAVMERGINTIPNVLHTTITYPEEMNHAMLDMDLLPDGEEVVYAAAEEDTATDVVTSVATVPETAAPQPEQTSFIDRVRQRLQDASSLNILLSGRMYNYTAYIRDMNLFGNDKKAIAYGTYTNYAHNGILAYAHTYGIYMIIPYIMTNLYLFYYAIRYRKKSFLPLGIFAVFFVENMMDNVDIPFHWVVWFVFALISGTLFREEESGECSRR